MSNYTKSTNFATKDSLASGNPLKIVKGTEIDTEFNNIATAIATKTDNASAAITGGSITGITDLAVADGGTGSSTASGARTNLGAAASGANSDITSLTGLTTALSVAQGGTGSTSLTANNVILGNGTSAVQTVAPGSSGNVLTSNGTTWSSSAPTSTYIGHRAQIFTSNGTFTIPTGVTAIKVMVVGGGGGGGGAQSQFCTSGLAGGGGGGGLGISYLTSLTPGNTISVTVGAGGSAGSAGGGTAGTGGTSSISSGSQSVTTISATGGTGGSYGAAGGFNNAVGGSAGSASGATINVRGNEFSASYGAESPLWGGKTPTTTLNGPGLTGQPYGGGASGAGTDGSGNFTVAGAVGSVGAVIFEW